MTNQSLCSFYYCTLAYYCSLLFNENEGALIVLTKNVSKAQVSIGNLLILLQKGEHASVRRLIYEGKNRTHNPSLHFSFYRPLPIMKQYAFILLQTEIFITKATHLICLQLKNVRDRTLSFLCEFIPIAGTHIRPYVDSIRKACTAIVKSDHYSKNKDKALQIIKLVRLLEVRLNLITHSLLYYIICHQVILPLSKQ